MYTWYNLNRIVNVIIGWNLIFNWAYIWKYNCINFICKYIEKWPLTLNRLAIRQETSDFYLKFTVESFSDFSTISLFLIQHNAIRINLHGACIWLNPDEINLFCVNKPSLLSGPLWNFQYNKRKKVSKPNSTFSSQTDRSVSRFPQDFPSFIVNFPNPDEIGFDFISNTHITLANSFEFKHIPIRNNLFLK